MAKFCRKVVASALVVLIIGSLFSIFPFAATGQNGNTSGTQAGQEARYTEKIVAVLFDDSWSMNDTPDKRLEYAKYAMQSLISLLGPNDTLIINGMNDLQTLQVDLTKEDRNAELQRVMKSSVFAPKGGTPGTSLEKPVKALQQYGLDGDSANKEYWMVVLTDGEFSELSAPDAFDHYIKDHPSLHAIYLGFGEAVDLSNHAKLKKYPLFVPFKANSTTSIIATMQNVANLMSGRFTMSKDVYEINDNKVTINLNKYEYSLKSLSVIAQNCGATVTSVRHNSSNMQASRPCIIAPDAKLGIKNGYSGVIEGTPYLSGGTIEIEFSAPVSDLSLLAEPALSMEAYAEHVDGKNYKRVTEQEISDTLRAGDTIRVCCEIFDQASGKKVDLKTLSGATETKVTYAGKTYKCDENFKLAEGNNIIAVEVSAMDGKFVMYDTLQCVVMADPSYYRVEAQSNDKISPTTRKVQTVYTIYIDNKPATKAQLDGIYTWEVSLKAADGTEIPLTTTLGSDGKISTNGTVPEYVFGTYTQHFTITSDTRITREHTCEMNYYPDNIVVSLVAGGGDSINETQLAKGQGKAFEFELLADGKPLAFDSGLTEFTLKLDGINVSSFCTTDGNKLTYVPTTGHTGKGALPTGTKEVELTVTAVDVPSLTSTSKGSFKLTPSAYVVEALDSNKRGIDRFALDESTAELYFLILRDGEALTPAEVKALYEDGMIQIEDDGTFSSYFWLPCAVYGTPEEKDGQGVITVRVKRDMINPFQTFFAMLIFSGEEAITVSYLEAKDSSNFVFESSSLWSYIWRILIIILIIYIIIYCIGFWKCKMFPAGTFVEISVNTRNAARTANFAAYPINFHTSDYVKWHLLRFIKPHRVLKSQEDKSINGYMNLYYESGTTTPRIRFVESAMELDIRQMNSQRYMMFTDYTNEVSSIGYAATVPTEITSGDVTSFFRALPNGGKGEDLPEDFYYGSTYGFYNNQNRLQNVIMFIQKY